MKKSYLNEVVFNIHYILPPPPQSLVIKGFALTILDSCGFSMDSVL